MSEVNVQWSSNRKENVYLEGCGWMGVANIYASFLCLISYFREALVILVHAQDRTILYHMFKVLVPWQYLAGVSYWRAFLVYKWLHLGLKSI